MNRAELKSSFSKIVPPEELIKDTLIKMEEQKRKVDKPILSFFKTPYYRYAAVFCAMFLVVGIGIGTLINQAGDISDFKDNSGKRSIGNTVNKENPGVVSLMLGEDTENVQEAVYEVDGTLEACYITAITDKEKSEGIVVCGILEVSHANPEDNISAKVYFYDYDTLNILTGAVGKEISLRLLPETEDVRAGWCVRDFAVKASE